MDIQLAENPCRRPRGGSESQVYKLDIDVRCGDDSIRRTFWWFPNKGWPTAEKVHSETDVALSFFFESSLVEIRGIYRV